MQHTSEVAPETFRLGQRVRTTDTERRAVILGLSLRFHMARVQYENGQEGWWAMTNITSDEGTR